MKAYAEDLAHVHDDGFDWLPRGATPAILEWMRAAGIHSGRVVDLGCGSGIGTRLIADAGYDVLGVDLSPAMLRIARARVPEARFVRASLLDVELPACDAVVSVGECGNDLFDRDNGPRALRRLFRRVHAALRPDGILAFDLAGPGRGEARREGLFEGDDWVMTLRNSTRARGTILRRDITTFRRRGRAWRRSDEVHELRLYRSAQVLEMLRAAGFRAQARRAYGDLALPPGLTAYRARKP